MTAVATALTPASAPAADDDTRRTHGAKQQHGRNDGPVVSRRLRWTAKAAALTLLPTGLWRTGIAFGMPSGFAEGNELHQSNFPGVESFYLVAISVFAELLGLLTLGLVQRWGEVVPHWVPWLGGRRIPTMAAVVPASVGAALVTLITIM